MRALFGCTLALFAAVCAVAQGKAQPGKAADIVVRPPTASFQFIVYGDIRFTDPANNKASDPLRRELLVRRIAREKPALLLITGDLVLQGANPADWQRFDVETRPLRDARIPLFPALGNHDVRGDLQAALDNYFQRFPRLDHRRWYSLQYGNCYFLMLDSMSDSPGGEQWSWLEQRLDQVPADAQFVFLAMHHPPITQSADQMQGGGHSARRQEKQLAQLIEQHRRPGAQYVVLSGHVHNYERYQHAGVTYIVSGGGGATPYMVERKPDDFYRDPGPSYHYCKITVDRGKLKFQMVKLELEGDKPNWTVRDSFELESGQAAGTTAGH